jgi:arginase
MIAVLAAPTNLGLKPPEPTSVPGCAKAPEALREAGLHRRLLGAGATDAGVVLPGRYVDHVVPGRLRNHDALLDHAHRLADRLDSLLADGLTPLVLGGDCSLLVGAGLGLARRGGRHGLVHIDGHTDFRHPGNSDACASLAGEDLAAAVGRHWPDASDPEGRGPSFAAPDVAHIGCRDDDEDLPEVRSLLGAVVPASHVIRDGAQAAEAARAVADAPGVEGYWLHLDVDVLDPAHVSAVDSPDPGGLDPEQLTELLTALAPRAVGAQVTVFDPDLDPGGEQARLLADVLVAGLGALGSCVPPRG